MAGVSKPPNEVANQFERMTVHRGRRQAVTDDDNKLAGITAAVGQRAPRSGIEHAAEIGAAQIVAPVLRLARYRERVQTEAGQLRHQARGIEGGMDGVARTRMVERESEQRLGRQA